MRPPAIAPSTRRRQRGLTLVELLVGLTLGLVVTASMLLLFANASARGQDVARAGMQIENGRYVSEMLREDLRLAGFYGETSVAGALYTQPDPCSVAPVGWGGTPLTLPTAVQGYTPADALACLDHRKAGTDAIAVRRVGITAIDPTTLSGANTQYYVQYSFCVLDVATPRLIFSNNKAAMTLRNRACGGVNVARPYVSRVYYVSECNVCAGAGDGIPTLKRVELVGTQLTTTALAEGIDALRVEYGFDIDGDGSPDTYLTALGAVGPTAAWSNVVSLKVHFVTRSLDKATGSNLATAQEFDLGGTAVIATVADGYTRRAYSSAIRLINPSSAREAQ
ncbi:MAG TPA: PilW family protein [Caldimonas sp.]|nr:PilW family protein [Caldimonas sp.]